MSAEEVAKAFVQHYYQTFDNNVDGLAGLFVRYFPWINGIACSFAFYGVFLAADINMYACLSYGN